MKKYKSYYLPGEFISEDRIGEGFICITEDFSLEGDLDLNPELDTEGIRKYLEKFGCPYGIVVDRINKISVNGKEIENPLETAGMKERDMLISVNGKTVTTLEELDAVLSAILEEKISVYEIKYVQDGEKKIVNMPVYHNAEDERARMGINIIFMKTVSGLYFMKDLNVTGNIINKNSNYGVILQVNGNVKAKNLIAGGANFVITGDADIEDTVLGFYNDGEFQVDGDLTCRTFMNYDHHMDCAPTAEDLVGDYGEYEFEEYLLPEYIDKFDDLIEAVLDGKEYRNPDRKSNSEISMSQIHERLKQDFYKLDISDCDFEEIPDLIYEQGQLESLKIGRMKINERIAGLTNLKELDMRKSYYLVPEYLYKLSSLEKLTIGIASQEDFDNICKIISLKDLRIIDSPQCFERFNEKITELINLTSLEVSGCAEPKAYDKADQTNKAEKEKVLHNIAKLTGLKNLNLTGSYLYTLTDDFINLKNLESLHLSGNPTLQNLPDFSHFIKLKELYFNGSSSYSSVPPADTKLLKQLLGTHMPSLETLYVERWKVDKEEELPNPHKNMPDLKKLVY